MKVIIEAPQFDPDVKLIEFIQKKLNKLEQFYDKIIHADVFLKLEPNNKPQNKIVEILISVPGDEFIIKKNSKSFEEGVDLCVQSLERVLLKRKEKIRAHTA
ncbi:ribosome hibernation-promoting factor, HPF/YfiA family [Dokdonia ponticola]|uniref:Ribosome hibernation-promoting factor, HPF/YfiA family n=1 Tax=Dokdonia ponticola TaxID=2041041 RepID=A0ABV9HQX7_9FLAO